LISRRRGKEHEDVSAWALAALILLILAKEPTRFRATALRWNARYCGDYKVSIEEATAVLGLFAMLEGRRASSATQLSWVCLTAVTLLPAAEALIRWVGRPSMNYSADYLLRMHDPYQLPPDLPVPLDDGAADHLLGLTLPSIQFDATTGERVDLRDAGAETLVLYIYPRTGKPGVELPAGWDGIPGARGCTPQSCAFRDLYRELTNAGSRVAGLSAQTSEDQREAATRLRLPFPLLADPSLELAASIGLPTFEIEGMRLYKRLTIIARHGEIANVLYPVFPPDENAVEVLSWLETHPSET
jgi:peroxiredoxin